MSGPYLFPDLSHYNKDPKTGAPVDFTLMPEQGVRMVIIKASDSWHMPDRAGKYDFAADRHFDPYFVEHHTRARATGLVVGAYHFVRPDIPNAAEANLRHYRETIELAGISDLKTPVLDFERYAQMSSMPAAKVTAIFKDIVAAFESVFERVVIYTNASTMNENITDRKWFLDRGHVWWMANFLPIVLNAPVTYPGFKVAVPLGFPPFSYDNPLYLGWQFSDRGKLRGVNSFYLDLNYTGWSKEELSDLFAQEIRVDPPAPPPSGDGGEAALALLNKLQSWVDARRDELT